MKTTTFEKRTLSHYLVTKQSNGFKYAQQVLTNAVPIYTCHISGRGRFATNLDYTGATIFVLELAGLKDGVDFLVQNDAPRGGKVGQFISLTVKGRRKMIKE